MYYVYVLYSKTLKKRYVGMCADLRKRVAEHNHGESIFTKGGKPWNLIYYQAFINKKDARKEELFLKSGKGRQRLDICLRESLVEISQTGEVA